MGGLAQILKDSGHDVSGSDMQFYPPMSEHLNALKIDLIEGYALDDLPEADLYVIGNALSRGNESVEHILNNRLPFKSGPEMLGEILRNRKVFAVSGTHGKTTTSYMLTHIFKSSGRDIGYLVGGISSDIDGSASLGTDEIFVIEADEYDSAFFDKRSKFIHYRPSTLVINNIEFDHADIFRDIIDIKRQFHHLVKTIPASGNIIFYSDDTNSQDVIDEGVWSEAIAINNSEIQLSISGQSLTVSGEIFSLKDLPLLGEHNLRNYSAAILAANKNGISINDSIESLKSFNGVKRRMELKGDFNGIKIFDDFAHHPTAIKMTSEAITKKFSDSKILGIIELASNTMSGGFHGDDLLNAPQSLSNVIWIDHKGIINASNKEIFNSIEHAISYIKDRVFDYDIILIMTNKNSSNIYNPLIKYLEKK